METKISMNLAEKLTALRKQNGLTQMELAERLNVSRQAVSRWEVGAAVPSTDNLKVLSELYGIRVDYLLNDGSEEENESTQVQENVIMDQKRAIKKSNRLPLMICIMAIVIAFVMLIGALVPRSQERDQVVPMEEMYTGPDDDYSEGTFTIK